MALFALLAAPSVWAADPNTEDASVFSAHGPAGDVIPDPTVPKELQRIETQPLPLRMIVHPTEKGMLIRLPIIDTDPNRGVTFGILPVWISNAPKEDRILSMQVPSLTYNPVFKTNFTHRYYYYPTKDSTLMLRGAISEVLEKELFAQYDNSNLFQKNGEVGWKLWYNVDASNRFYGIGPATSRFAVSNYVFKYMTTEEYFGLPVYTGSNWYWTVQHRISGNALADGPVKTVPAITALYPTQTPAHWHQNAALRGYLTYDTLDNSITTTRGTYAEFFAESSQRALASEYTFQRYSADLREFYHVPGDDTFVTAGRVKFEQVIGDGVPFWLMPYLGGKYTFPGYGDGRYTNLGVAAAVLEERMIAFRMTTGGVACKFEIAPMAGIGSSFDTPGHMTSRYARPLFGLGLRAIAPPQVVGSIDVGIGQEGASVFMDINYPF